MIIPAKEQTSAAVAQHYDDLDPFYRELWGDHVHHGLWTTGLENPTQAVENLIACVALRFLWRDWLDNRFETGSFDHIVAIESSEHMADKQHFFDEAYRTLRPGGRLAVCAWLARSDPRPWEVRHLLEPICREG